MITLPPDGAGLNIIASVSGGKDSTALILALREAAIPARFVFADTGWEADETYEYLDYLRAKLNITIDVVGVDGGMEARCRVRAGFPGRRERFCTRELKIEPLRDYHDKVEAATEIETVSVLGERAAESQARANRVEWEDQGPSYTRERWGGYIWRPLIRWTVTDVLETHRRNGVEVNPLYKRGHNRVGCYPCIFASKEEITLVAKHAPEKIDRIRDLETELTALRASRNQEMPGRYEHTMASFFQTLRKGFYGIDEVVSWASTKRGGDNCHCSRRRRAAGACNGVCARSSRPRPKARTSRDDRIGRPCRRAMPAPSLRRRHWE